MYLLFFSLSFTPLIYIALIVLLSFTDFFTAFLVLLSFTDSFIVTLVLLSFTDFFITYLLLLSRTNPLTTLVSTIKELTITLSYYLDLSLFFSLLLYYLN